MKLTIRSTSTLTHIDGVPCRLWEGTTASGTEVWVFVRLISVPADADTAELDRDLVGVMRTAGDKFIPFKDLHP